MAADNIEIEIRIRLEESEFRRLKAELDKTAKFIKSSHQVDEYFTPAHRNFLAQKFPSEWLSVRNRDGRIILNYKHFYPEGVEITTHCDEFETEVKDGKQMDSILKSLDFKSLMTVEKERDCYVHGDYEIVLDKVNELGYFVEIEALKNFGSHEETKEKLVEFAKALGVNIANAEPRGYIENLLRKKGMI